MDGDSRRSRLRSFAIGGALGAAGTIAAVRRRSRPRRGREGPSGLAAFEDAPCFLEAVGEEPQPARDGETTAGAEGAE
ncbi:MAG TPA: hypothetical protein VFA82_01535 [Gaiellaceae bacterium]|nr:hypothetical protein [Gaiellaceae bacterium]